MAATIKPIEAKSVHQIQSGQVIVDLCSVAKELVENALDADATSIEIRFKNYGLDSIEVQDNGTGIAEANYQTLALKHYTSKLSTYEDLSELQTFGFRGEALSSLSALSNLSVLTAEAHEAPKGKRLEFEVSGKLKSSTVAAAQRGTTITVESLFSKLPVRQKELSKNIKREYGKVLGLLHAYACISTQVKFTVKNALAKGRSAVVFSTNGNTSTRDNIANVYGAKMLPQLIELDLKLDFQPTAKRISGTDDGCAKVSVVGHISKPVFGEGRQTPDRQMFFVNGRPCGLPQIGKAINEIYKSYNVSQSPFVFADFRMDTNNYDVNVSPDKRTILLHNAASLIERLKEELTKRFDDTEQTVPQSQVQGLKLPGYHQLTVSRGSTKDGSPASGNLRSPTAVLVGRNSRDEAESEDDEDQEDGSHKNLLNTHFGNIASTRENEPLARKVPDPAKVQKVLEKQAEKIARSVERGDHLRAQFDENDDVVETPNNVRDTTHEEVEEEQPENIPVRDFNARMQEQQKTPIEMDEPSPIHSIQSHSLHRRVNEIGVLQNAFNRMRPRRLSPELATITIGDKVITRMIGTPRRDVPGTSARNPIPKNQIASQFSQSLRKFNVDETDDDSQDEDNGIEGQENYALVINHTPVDSSEDTEKHRGPHIGIEAGNNHHGVDLADNSMDFPESAQIDVAEEQDRKNEECRVAELIRLAEVSKQANSKERQRRTAQATKVRGTKDSTTNIVAVLDMDVDDLLSQATLEKTNRFTTRNSPQTKFKAGEVTANNDEERLSLTISKSDFSKMHIAGQFNLGFILALRYQDSTDIARQKDELFIIDQHASDEKYNFERLQAETIVGNQRLVHPVMLELTAVEEEIVLENSNALQQNGFIIDADLSGKQPVGERCQLLSLPLSKEVTFNTRDLEELIHLLSEAHISADSTYIPRPSKVRKMFAMRACRSSIMIGKTLSTRQMRSVLENMGRIDKPWNCPHGRPTMRHLTSLDDLDEQLWVEGNGLKSEATEQSGSMRDADVWRRYVA